MKVGKYKINTKNIRAYIQGNIRSLAEKFDIDFLKLKEHEQEQVLFRDSVSKPSCKEKEECDCGCPIPKLYMADKTCEDGCYPEMMNETEWNKFKETIVENKIPIQYPFIWHEIKEYISDDDIKLDYKLISTEDSVVSLGDVKKGVIAEGAFTLVNPLQSILELNRVQPSCGCTTVDFPKTIGSIKEGVIKFKVDTGERSLGVADLWITVTYNKMNKLNLNIKLNVI